MPSKKTATPVAADTTNDATKLAPQKEALKQKKQPLKQKFKTPKVAEAVASAEEKVVTAPKPPKNKKNEKKEKAAPAVASAPVAETKTEKKPAQKKAAPEKKAVPAVASAAVAETKKEKKAAPKKAAPSAETKATETNPPKQSKKRKANETESAETPTGDSTDPNFEPRRNKKQKPAKQISLFFGNCPSDFKEEDARSLIPAEFAEHIVRVSVVKSKKDAVITFVDFCTTEQVTEVVKALKGAKFGGKELIVDMNYHRNSKFSRVVSVVGGKDLNQAKLEQKFSKYGWIVSSRIEDGNFLVKYLENDAVSKAIEGLNDTTFEGVKLQVIDPQKIIRSKQWVKMFRSPVAST